MIVPAENLVSGPVGPTDRPTEVPRSRLSGRQEQGRNNPQDGLEVDASHCVSSQPPPRRVRLNTFIVEPKSKGREKVSSRRAAPCKSRCTLPEFTPVAFLLSAGDSHLRKRGTLPSPTNHIPFCPPNQLRRLVGAASETKAEGQLISLDRWADGLKFHSAFAIGEKL